MADDPPHAPIIPLKPARPKVSPEISRSRRRPPNPSTTRHELRGVDNPPQSVDENPPNP